MDAKSLGKIQLGNITMMTRNKLIMVRMGHNWMSKWDIVGCQKDTQIRVSNIKN